ncbi:hypothetical protein MCERE10_03636 [Burkholderiaceae bacterium]
MHNQFRPKLRFLLLILLLLTANGTPALAQTSSAAQQDQIEKCVTNKVALFRKQMGEGPLIRFDMLEEWRGECTGELARKNKPSQANTTPPASNTRQGAPQASSSTETADVLAQCSAIYYLHYEDAKKKGQSDATRLQNLHSKFKQSSMQEYKSIGVDPNRVNAVGTEIISNYHKGLAVDQKNGTNKAVNWINNFKQACDKTARTLN